MTFTADTVEVTVDANGPNRTIVVVHSGSYGGEGCCSDLRDKRFSSDSTLCQEKRKLSGSLLGRAERELLIRIGQINGDRPVEEDRVRRRVDQSNTNI